MKLIKSLLSSKKFVAAMLALIGGIGVKLGMPETTVSELSLLIAPLLVYIGAQGLADNQKEAQQLVIDAKRDDEARRNAENDAR